MSDDDEKLKNFLLCKVYMTDKELEDSSPSLIVILILGICFVLFCILC
jgi:F0F1-type ATP synthase assembly protein I